MTKLALALVLLLFLPLGAHAAEQCPDGDVKWNAITDEFVYALDDPNAYEVWVEAQEDGWDVWTVGRLGCVHCAVCISYGDELAWRLNPGTFGAAQNADHIVWWGACQTPCRCPLEALPNHAFAPLVFKGPPEAGMD